MAQYKLGEVESAFADLIWDNEPLASSRLVVPGAREAMDKFKMEAANDSHVPIPS